MFKALEAFTLYIWQFDLLPTAAQIPDWQSDHRSVAYRLPIVLPGSRIVTIERDSRLAGYSSWNTIARCCGSLNSRNVNIYTSRWKRGGEYYRTCPRNTNRCRSAPLDYQVVRELDISIGWVGPGDSTWSANRLPRTGLAITTFEL